MTDEPESIPPPEDDTTITDSATPVADDTRPIVRRQPQAGRLKRHRLQRKPTEICKSSLTITRRTRQKSKSSETKKKQNGAGSNFSQKCVNKPSRLTKCVRGLMTFLRTRQNAEEDMRRTSSQSPDWIDTINNEARRKQQKRETEEAFCNALRRDKQTTKLMTLRARGRGVQGLFRLMKPMNRHQQPNHLAKFPRVKDCF